ncbi:hypothetical protein ACVD1N_25275 [Vibrio parahaemolyticus]
MTQNIEQRTGLAVRKYEISAQTVHDIADSSKPTTKTPSGKTVPTWVGQLSKTNYLPPILYSDGITFDTTDIMQTVERLGVQYAPKVGELPFMTTGVWEGADKDKFYIVRGLTIDQVGGLNGYSFNSIDDMKSGMTSGGLQIAFELNQALRVSDSNGVSLFTVVDTQADFELVGGLWARRKPTLAGTSALEVVVGNDPQHTDYEFSQLNDALTYATSYRIAAESSGYSRVRIIIPSGKHKFKPLHFRNADLTGIQVWGAGRSECEIQMELSNKTDGIWANFLFTQLGDWGGFKLQPDDQVTVATDPNITCQMFYGDGLPPWHPEKNMTAIGMLGGSIERLWGVECSGNTDGVRLGSALNVSAGAIVGTVDDFHVKNIRDGIVAYNGSIVSVGYAGYHASNIYNGLVNHESTVTIRTVHISGKLKGSVPWPGSIAFDCFRGRTTLWEGSVSNFEYYHALSAAVVTDELSHHVRSNVTKPFYWWMHGNFISLDWPNLPVEDLFSSNQIVQGTAAAGLTMGTLTYAGDNTGSRVLVTLHNPKKATVRRLSDNLSVTTIAGGTGLVGGNPSLWVNDKDGTIRVYNDMNRSGEQYELIWER